MLALTAAAPVTELAALNDLETRQIGPLTENEFVDGGCRDTIFLFARGSQEFGNMGFTVGPGTARSLRAELGDETWPSRASNTAR